MTQRLGRVLLVVPPATWAAWNGVRYVLDGTLRHRAEAAWFILAGILVTAGLWATVGARSDGESPPDSWRPSGPSLLILFWAVAFALYGPILSAGLLSDDFTLLDRARGGVLIDRSWDYVRPLPLLIWQVIDSLLPASMVPGALHVLNVALHGLNAWLVYRLAAILRLEWRGAMAAAILFLTWSFSVEPVVWASGIFDIALTTFALATVLTVLSAPQTPKVAFVVVGLTAAALACKETAVALPLLLVTVSPLALPTQSFRKTVGLIALCALTVGAYIAWRVTNGLPEVGSTAASGYILKELLSRPFGALGLGLHQRVILDVPVLAGILSLLWPALIIRPIVHTRVDRTSVGIIALACLWVLVSVLPLLAMFFVGSDLQGSRYLYLGSSVWSIAVVTMANPAVATAPNRTATAALICLVLISVAAVRMHQRPWLLAATTTQRIVTALQVARATCRSVTATGLPDNIDGAYVFRNGFSEAFAMLPADPNGTESCHLRWQGDRFVRSPP